MLGSFSIDDAKQTLEDIQMMCARALETIGQGRHINRGSVLPTTPVVNAREGIQQHDYGMTSILQPSSETDLPSHSPVPGKGKAASARGRVKGKGRERVHDRTPIVIGSSPSPSSQAEPAQAVAQQTNAANEMLAINVLGEVAPPAPHAQTIVASAPPGVLEHSEAESYQGTMPKKKKSKNS